MGQTKIKCNTCRCLVEAMIHGVFYYFCWDTSEIFEKKDLLQLHKNSRPDWCKLTEPYIGNFEGSEKKLCYLMFPNANGE